VVGVQGGSGGGGIGVKGGGDVKDGNDGGGMEGVPDLRIVRAGAAWGWV